MNNQPQQPPDRPPTWLEKAKSVVDIAKSIGIVCFIGFALYFLWSDLDDLFDLLHNLRQFEFAGVKLEIGERDFGTYSSQVQVQTQTVIRHIKSGSGQSISNLSALPGVLSEKDYNAINARGMWLAPVLAGANVLWLDPAPEFSNAERQLIESFRINISLSRSLGSALEDLKNNEHKFDLVVTTLTRVPPNDRLREPLAHCPVHWFQVPDSLVKQKKAETGNSDKKSLSEPEMNALLESWNKQTNEGIHTGFLLAEHMYAEITDEKKRPGIIIYTNYDQQVMTPCSQTVTADAFTLYDSVFNHLARDRWQIMQRFTPPWAKKQSAGT